MITRKNFLLPRGVRSLFSERCARAPVGSLPFLYPRWFHSSLATAVQEQQKIPGETKPQASVVRKNTRSYGRRRAAKSPQWTDVSEREETSKQHPKTTESLVEWKKAMDELIELRELTREEAIAQNQKVLYLDERVLVNLVGDEKENVWDTAVVSGCRIHVLSRRHHDERGHRKVILTGSQQAIELAEKNIAETAASIGNNYPEFIPPGLLKSQKSSGGLRVYATWTEPSGPPDYKKRFRDTGSLLPQPPETFTVRSFADYAYDLTRPPPPHSLHRLVYSPGEEHRFVIRDIIYNLFNDRNNRQFFSTRALNALVFYFYHHEFLPHLLALFPKFEDLMTVRTFNVMLEGSSSRRDFNIFRYMIRLMKAFQIKPNGVEWVSFLRSIRDVGARSVVLDRMKEDGLLDDHHLLAGAMAITVPDSFASHLRSQQSVSSYIKLMNNRYGPGWLTTDVINIMVQQCARYNRRTDVYNLLLYCNERGCRVNTVTLNFALASFFNEPRGTLSHQTQGASNSTHGILFYLWFRRAFPQVPYDDETTRRLFTIAWKKRAYNSCRVLWRYACVYGATNWDMQMKIKQSINKNTGNATPYSQDQWWMQVGKIAAGISIDPEYVSNAFPELRNRVPEDLRGNPMAYLVGYTSGKPREQQIELAKYIISCDLAAVGKYAAVRKRDEMLYHAYVMDTEYEEPGKSTYQLLRDVIQVPFNEKSLTTINKVQQKKGKNGKEGKDEDEPG